MLLDSLFCTTLHYSNGNSDGNWLVCYSVSWWLLKHQTHIIFEAHIVFIKKKKSLLSVLGVLNFHFAELEIL